MNPLETEGISNLCAALMRCSIPADLRLRGVGLGGFIAVTFASMLKYNRSLKELDLADNEINEDAGRVSEILHFLQGILVKRHSAHV